MKNYKIVSLIPLYASSYLPPTDDYNDPELALAVEGGPTGSEFTVEFLSKAKNYLDKMEVSI